MQNSLKLATGLAALWAVDAYGYVDPGSGYLILQAIAAFFLAGLFYIKAIYRFFAGLFKRKGASPPASEAASGKGTESNPDSTDSRRAS